MPTQIMNRFGLVGLLVSCLVCLVTCEPIESCFRAAVLDHVQQTNYSAHNRLVDIELNLEVYASAAKLAKLNGADIIVFPEDGIIFGLHNRTEAAKYGEQIPSTKAALCSDTLGHSHPVLHRLGCIAKQNNIYLVADLIDVLPCVHQCPSDSKFVFNTAVLIDRTGSILAKYHKMHPFNELYFDVPPTDELVVVQTEIGRLGLQVCFDMIFKAPGVLLASQHKLDTMLFPTWWFDQLPFLTASQFQLAWAWENKVNLLASNIHRVEIGSKGSGIYAGARQQFEMLDYIDGSERLLLATLPINATSSAQCPMNGKTLLVPHKMAERAHSRYNYMPMDVTNMEMVRLDSRIDLTVLKCHQGVCCSVQYKTDKSSINENEGFYLVVSNRTRKGVYPWNEEFCALVHCNENQSRDKCINFTMKQPAQTKFTFVQVTGEFSGATSVYPSALDANMKVFPQANLWSYHPKVSNATETKSNNSDKYVLTFGQNESNAESYGVMSISLYGRPYDRDPPFDPRPSSARNQG